MIKKVTMYEASDGTQHTSKDAAIWHEQQIDLQSYIDENPIYGTGGYSDGKDLMIWLKDNPRVFIKLLPEEKLTEEYYPDGQA